MESLFACSVDLFILISGYFMSKNSKRTIIKPLELILQVILFKEILFLAKVLIGREPFSILKIMNNLIPTNWFVMLYVTLYLISPAINVVIEKATEKDVLRKFVVIFFMLFSIYPTGVDLLQEILGRDIVGISSVGMYGSQWGYSIVNFTLMYFLGACLKRVNVNKLKNMRYLLRIFILTGSLMIWAYLNDLTGYGTERTAWEYCNPLVILLAVEIFMLFKQTNLGTVNYINGLAKGSFTVFLLHNSLLPFIKIERLVTLNFLLMLVLVFLSAGAIYVVCWGVYKIYEFVSRPIYNWLIRRIPLLTQNIYEGL